MKKCQGLLNHLLYSKKNNASHSLDNTTSNNVNKIVDYNSKVSKSKPKVSLNKTQEHKMLHSSVEKRKFLPPQNFSNNSKVKNQNHSFTTTISSESLFLHLSNKKSPINQNKPSNPHPPVQNQEPKVIPMAFMQSMNNKNSSTYYNKMKQKMMSSTIIQDKQPSNLSFYQLNKGVLSTMKNPKDKNVRRGQYLNKSMNNYEEEWYDKESNSNILQSISMMNRIKSIEDKLENQLSSLQQGNDGRIVSNVKSYNLYKKAFEEIVKELPKDYHGIIKKIINGYHQITITFVNEQKKILENFNELKTKYSSISQELSAYKAMTNNIEKYGERKINKTIKPIEVKTIQVQKSEGSNIKNTNLRQRHQNMQETNNHSIYGHTTVNNTSKPATSNFNTGNIEPLKFELFQYDIEDNTCINNTNSSNINQTISVNKMDFEDLDALYFSDRVDMGDHSPINMTKNVPKLSLDFLG